MRALPAALIAATLLSAAANARATPEGTEPAVATPPAGLDQEIARDIERIRRRLLNMNRVKGKLERGDASIAYEAFLDEVRLVHLHETIKSGDYGSAVEDYYLRGEWPFAWTRSSRRVEPGPPSHIQEEFADLAFDDFGQPLQSHRRKDGQTSVPGKAEVDGVLEHYRMLRADLARRLSGGRTGALAATWTAELPAASSEGRTIRLTLTPNHVARLESDYRNGRPPIVQEGWWTATAGDLVIVILVIKDGQVVQPWRLEFRRDEKQLTGKDLDVSVWGTAGLVLTRGAEILPADVANVRWEWVSLTSPLEKIVPEDPGHYTVTFGTDGRMKVRADCNRGTAGYVMEEGRRLVVSPLALTRTMCASGSLDARFAREMQRATSFFVRDGRLYLELPVDSGTLEFRRAE